MKAAIVDLRQFLGKILGRLRILSVIILIPLLLSGCVKYDVGINFAGQHHGEIVQHIKLGERLTNFSNSQTTEWLKSIERRARKLRGRTKHVGDQEIIVTIPFNNGAELSSKFNQFFNPIEKKGYRSKAVESIDLPNFDSKFRLDQGNFLLVQRNHLSYDLDLRSLGVLSENGDIVVSPNSLLDLQFSLETPWGARNIEESANAIIPESYDDGHQLVWQLQPGQLNHIEVIFWLPSPLGVGSIVILLLVLGGFYLKYQSFPWQGIEPVVSSPLPKV
ncbi:MAG: DUF3153 domain-containing protein [Symploca sp. SIO2C1]|nr:DUF3153 domain-containing protein [Symploca sp. SIO2C1]